MLSVVLSFVFGTGFLGLLFYNVGKWLFQKDDKWERLAESFLELASILSEYGLTIIPSILKKLAIKDFSGAWKIVTDFVALLQLSPEAVLKEFDKTFDRVLDAKLQRPESRMYLKARIAEAEAKAGALTHAA